MAANVELIIKAIDETQEGLKSAEGGLGSLEATAKASEIELEILETRLLRLKNLLEQYPDLGKDIQSAFAQGFIDTPQEAAQALNELEERIITGGKNVEGYKNEIKDAEKANKKFATSMKQLAGGLIGFSTFLLLGRKVANTISDIWKEGTKLNQEFRAGAPEVQKYTVALQRQDRVLKLLAMSYSALFMPGATGVLGGIGRIIEKQTAMNLAIQMTDEQAEKTGITFNRLTHVFKDAETGAVVPVTEALSRMAEVMGFVIDKGLGMSSSTAAWARQMAGADEALLRQAGLWEDEISPSVRDALGEAEDFTEELRSAEEKAQGIGQAISAFWDGVERDIAGTILDQIKDIEFVLAGGDTLQNITQMLQDALRAGFDPAVVNELLKATFVEAIALDVKLGEIEPAEGAADVAALLGISEESAAQLIADIISGAVDLVSEQSILDVLGGQISDPLTAAFEEIQSQASIMSGGIIAEMSNVLTQGIEPMNAELAKSIEYFLTLGGFPKVTITIETEGGGGDTMP